MIVVSFINVCIVVLIFLQCDEIFTKFYQVNFIVLLHSISHHRILTLIRKGT